MGSATALLLSQAPEAVERRAPDTAGPESAALETVSLQPAAVAEAPAAVEVELAPMYYI